MQGPVGQSLSCVQTPAPLDELLLDEAADELLLDEAADELLLDEAADELLLDDALAPPAPLLDEALVPWRIPGAPGAAARCARGAVDPFGPARLGYDRAVAGADREDQTRRRQLP